MRDELRRHQSLGSEEPQIKFNEAPFDAVFDVGDELGSGQFAVVRKVVKKATGEEFAAKFIKKRRYATSRRGVTRANIEREVSVLRTVGGHSNVIELHEVYETPSDVILVLELVSGGELFDHVCARECLDEVEAAAFIRQILLGIKHLHSLHIVHLDIKPENVMLKKRGDSQVKLIDFGLSRLIPPGHTVKDMVGTPEFVAPEVVNYEPLSPATDMWALGVVTYILLSGGSPFLGDTRDETFCNITGVNYHFTDRYFKNTSTYAKDFISRLFVRDVQLRATVGDCLRHPWIRGPDGGDVDLRKTSSIAISHIHSFKQRQRWRRAIELVLICNRVTRSVRLAISQATKMKRTIETRYDPNDMVTSSLLIAAENGGVRELNELSMARGFPNLRNKQKETAAHVAAGAGHIEALNFLTVKGAQLSMEDERGEIPLHWAARSGHANVVAVLANERVSVNALNKNGESSLLIASRHGHHDVVHVLLERGASSSIQDQYGDTPLHCAASHGHSRLLRLLCSSKSSAPLLLRNQDEETALHCAAARGHLECVQTLLDAGSSVDDFDNHHRTPLLCALENGHLDIALLLIHKGSKINEPDDHANTPLHVAARLGLLTAVQTLCHCGANVDLANQDSLTPLHLAAREGFLDIVRVLCLARSNVARKTKDGLTAEILALASEHTHVASLLSKIKQDNVRENYIDQLCPLHAPLRRIKLKLFGHSQTGKSRLVQSLHSTRGITSTIIDAVSRRISDHYSPSNTMSKDDGIHSGQGSSFSSESNNNSSEQCGVHLVQCPAHSAYTRGIDVQNINCAGCGEFSVWEFGGYEPYHMAYDHFVGNTDCIHVVLFKATDSTEEQYKQVLYWMNFLKGRVTPTEPIGHCGIISRRSKVVIVGTHATSALFPSKNSEGEFESSDTEAMLKTVRLRFETHFDICDKLLLLDSTNPSCAGMKALKNYLKETRTTIISRLQKPIGLLEATMPYLQSMRKQHANFPVVSWPTFASIVRTDVNPLTGDAHCRQLIQQLQLIGEVVYLRDETAEMDYVVLNPEWLGTHIIGQLLSAEFLSRCRINGIYSLEHFAPIFPEIPEPTDLLRMLDVLQLCAPAEPDSEETFEFPAFILATESPDVWVRNKSTYVYGGVRVHPMRGMERSLQSTFPRIQVALRRSMHDFQDPMDADLIQWAGCSKMSSGQMEALVRIRGDAVEVQVRGPAERATSCFYFLEDVVNLVEQTASEVAPGIGLERHFLSPKALQEHHKNPPSFPPEAMMAMQQQESLTVKGTHDEEELFTDVVCFGSREVARLLTLGIDVGVADLSITTRCELAALLDPPDAMGRDWSILAVKLHLTDQVPEVDSTGQSLSRTDQLLAEWAIQQPEHATVGRLCEILAELGRSDARDTLYRTVPLYLFAPLDDTGVHPTDCGDSGVVSSCHSTGNPRTSSIS
uniref:Non-specific serine/threonine protein kinase n=1 Tax=Haemonchus contortus TaxID=6289 RepID=A0A7I4Y1A2_HAECO